LEELTENINDLNEKQIAFCKNFVSKEFFGNGVQSYIDAYGIDLSLKGSYDSAKACAYKLLTDKRITDKINYLLEKEGLNDEFVDKQLLLLITQNADFAAKAKAIAEYNKLKSRITEKKLIGFGGAKQIFKIGDTEIEL